jgi:hypothetical protein
LIVFTVCNGLSCGTQMPCGERAEGPDSFSGKARSAEPRWIPLPGLTLRKRTLRRRIPRACARHDREKSGRPGTQSRPTCAAAQRTSRRHLRGVKEELGNRRPAKKPNRRARQAQKEGVGTENQRPVFFCRDGLCYSIELKQAGTNFSKGTKN